LLNSYILLIIGALLVGAYVKGCTDEKARFDSYKLAVKAVGDAQEARTREKIAAQKLAKKETDDAHAAKIQDLTARNAATVKRLQRELASLRILPAVPGAAEGGTGLLCFQADELERRMDGALAKLLDRTAGVLQRGGEAATVAETCATWAMKEWKGL